MALCKVAMFCYVIIGGNSLDNAVVYKQLIHPTGYNSDLIHMQEVDEKFFKRDLTYVLGQYGFSGVLKLKARDTSEGSAIFYRNTKFKYVVKDLLRCVG